MSPAHARNPLEVLAEVAARPRLRGALHFWAFFVALVAGGMLVARATTYGSDATIACAIYAVSVCGMLGTSAAYHRVRWRRPGPHAWMRRLDHSMIFVLIAGTYTPVAILALDGTLRTVIAAVVWGGALAGIGLKLLWIDHPRWISAVVYIGLGWVAVAATGQLADTTGASGVTLFVVGGLLYSVGAVVYARQRPEPRPGVFGYHELFHALVVVALAVHFAAIAFRVLPQA